MGTVELTADLIIDKITENEEVINRLVQGIAKSSVAAHEFAKAMSTFYTPEESKFLKIIKDSANDIDPTIAGRLILITGE